ncbi:MAG: helix-turn-helix domain-containing protein [Dehalococcoidia bacterium]
MPARSTQLAHPPLRRPRLAAGERRAQILEVAQQAFLRAGYRGTTALEISREAGVSEKLVLKHFGSKEGLFRAAVVEPLLALMTSANEDARARMTGAPGDDSPEQAFQRVHRFLSMWAALVRERGPLIVAFIAEMREFPDVARQLGELFSRQVDETTDILSMAIQHGAFRPFDPRVAFLAALGAATVAALASDDADAFLDEYLKLTLFGVLTDEARLAANEGSRS